MIALSLEILIFIVLFVSGHIFWVYPDFIHGYRLEFPLGVQDHCHFISRAQVPLLDISFVFNLGVESPYPYSLPDGCNVLECLS